MTRRSAEGHIGTYTTAKGTRWFWKAVVQAPDGTRKTVFRRGFGDAKAASKAMREALTASDKGGFADPSKQLLSTWLETWLSGLRLEPSTQASYRMNVRRHITPYLGQVPLKSLTSAMLNKLYTDLEASGRRGRHGEVTGEPLSARSVQYAATILGAALNEAVSQDLLARNPAKKSKPPTAKQAKAPEMRPWTAAQLGAFLAWAEKNSADFPAWQLLAATGMRRGELIGLRWRDIDLAAGTVTIRHSVGVVEREGAPGHLAEGPPKNGKSRVVDIDADTVAVLKGWKHDRGSLALALARDTSLVFGDLENHWRHPVRLSAHWSETVVRARYALGTESMPQIRLHDLRHTHCTLLLQAGEPVHIVSRRVGHANASITLNTYTHVLPGDQRRAANRYATLMAGA